MQMPTCWDKQMDSCLDNLTDKQRDNQAVRQRKRSKRDRQKDRKTDRWQIDNHRAYHLQAGSRLALRQLPVMMTNGQMGKRASMALCLASSGCLSLLVKLPAPQGSTALADHSLHSICVLSGSGFGRFADTLAKLRIQTTTVLVHLLMGRFKGVVFHHCGHSRKQPIKQQIETPTSTMALMDLFPSLLGRFPTLLGCFPEFA